MSPHERLSPRATARAAGNLEKINTLKAAVAHSPEWLCHLLPRPDESTYLLEKGE